MNVDIADLKIELGFGISIDVMEYEAGVQEDRYSRVMIRIKHRDRERVEISELRISMPAEYATCMAHHILEETIEPPPSAPSSSPS